MKSFTAISILIIVFALFAGYFSAISYVEGNVSATSLEMTTINFNDSETSKLLQSVVEKYKKLRYYKSNGLNESILVSSGKIKKQIETDLEIDYKSPSNLKLVWNEDDERKEFHIDGEKSYLLNANGKKEIFEDNSWGILSTSDDDDIRKFLIARGLFGEVTKLKSAIDIWKNPQITGEEEVDGKKCHVVKGDLPMELGEMTLWIDKENLFIVKIKQFFPLRKGNNSYHQTQETYFDIDAK